MKRFIICMSMMIGLGSAWAMPPNPGACPTVANIQQAGLNFVDQDSSGYTAMQISNYGTNAQWAFALVDINASSQQDAFSKAYQALGTLYGNPSPVPVASEGVWACLYYTNMGYHGMAFTPLPSSKIASSLMHQLV